MSNIATLDRLLYIELQLSGGVALGKDTAACTWFALLCFFVVVYGTILSIFFRVTSMAHRQPYDCAKVSDASLSYIGEYIKLIWMITKSAFLHISVISLSCFQCIPNGFRTPRWKCQMWTLYNLINSKHNRTEHLFYRTHFRFHVFDVSVLIFCDIQSSMPCKQFTSCRF